MTARLFALVDCNNFYVSCERVFNASSEHRPVIVLGNNDGCVVARSQEAKALGITMGMPLFKCQRLVEKHQILVYSSNYALYQDLSQRVMRILSTWTRQMEVYSIDEAFLDCSHVPLAELTAYGTRLRAQVLQWTGIPVSVGIAPTKVLAKVACEEVKRTPAYRGVLSLVGMPELQLDELLSHLTTEQLWGIGNQSAQILQRHGIITARGLKHADHVWLRHLLNVRVQRVALELRGISCLPLEMQAKPRQGIMVSQSFGQPVMQVEELQEAVAFYMGRAAEKLRKQQSQAAQVSIFIHTNPFDKQRPQYANGAQQHLPFPTAFTPELIRVAHQLVQAIYRPGYHYKKAGVSLSHITPQEVIQPDLFGDFSWEEQARHMRLMCVIDLLNERWGRDTVFWSAQGFHRQWQMKQRRRSPCYTTRWDELLLVT